MRHSHLPHYYALIELDIERELTVSETGRERKGEGEGASHDMDRWEHTLIGIEARLMLPHNMILCVAGQVM